MCGGGALAVYDSSSLSVAKGVAMRWNRYGRAREERSVLLPLILISFRRREDENLSEASYWALPHFT
jgi:hypothetical protein